MVYFWLPLHRKGEIRETADICKQSGHGISSNTHEVRRLMEYPTIDSFSPHVGLTCFLGILAGLMVHKEKLICVSLNTLNQLIKTL